MHVDDVAAAGCQQHVDNYLHSMATNMAYVTHPNSIFSSMTIHIFLIQSPWREATELTRTR